MMLSKLLRHRREGWLLAILSLAMATGVFWHFHPGAMSPDSLTILAQARSGIWEDGAPPFMAAIWSLIDQVWPGPAGMLTLNLFLFYGGLFLVFLTLSFRHRRVWLGLVILGIYPPIVGILGAIWTDVMMAAFFIAGIGLFIISGYFGPAARLGSRCVALLLLALGSSVRHNGAAAMLPLIATGLYIVAISRQTGNEARPTPWRSICGAMLLTFGIFGISSAASRHFVDVPRYFWRVAAIYDIAGSSYESQRDLFSPGLFQQNSLEDINALYSPRSVTSLIIGEQIHLLPGEAPRKAKAFDPAELPLQSNPVLLANWRDVVIHHPVAFLKHRWQVFNNVIGSSPWGLWAPVFDAIYENNMGIMPRDTVHGFYFDCVRKLAYHSSIFTPCWYLLVASLLLIPSFMLGRRHGNEWLLLSAGLFASGLLHMLSLLFLAASADYRFSHWLVTSTSLGTMLLVFEWRKISSRPVVISIHQ